MARKRITLSLSDEDWGNLHILRLLFTIGNPYVNQLLNYGDITRLMLLTTFYSTNLDESVENDFMNEKHEYVERITIAEFGKSYSLFMEKWKEKIESRKKRLLISRVIPRGNFVYTADQLDIEIIDFLRNVLISKGMEESDTTDPKIIRKCIRFIFNSPVYLYSGFASAYISNVYGMRVYFPVLKEIEAEDFILENIKDKKARALLVETPTEITSLFSLSKDSRIFIEFLSNLSSFENLDLDHLKEIKGKYWSTMGFDILDMLIGMAISMRLLFNQDEWLPDLIVNRNFAKLDVDLVVLFIDELDVLLESTRPYSDIYNKEYHSTLFSINELFLKQL